MAINFPLLHKVVEHIEKHPEQHEQTEWRCETGMCVAGWTAHFAGGKFVSDDPDSVDYMMVDDGKEKWSVSTFAEHVLGLGYDEERDEYDGDELFAPSNSLEDIKRIVKGWEDNGR